MDIYHETLMKNFFVYGIDGETKTRINKQFNFQDHILIKQLDDINKNKYTLAIYNKAVSKIVAVYGESEKEINLESFEEHFGEEYKQSYFTTCFYLDVELKKYMPNKIVLYFIKDIADPIEIPIEYEFADEKAYYEKKDKEKLELYKNKVNITVNTGNDLVNISFRPCDDNYCRTEVELYCNENFIGTFKNNEGMYMIPVKGLADGTYRFRLTQFDCNDNKLYASDFIEFRICPSLNNSDDDYDDYWNEYDEYNC